jgi:hypothetical protein
LPIFGRIPRLLDMVTIAWGFLSFQDTDQAAVPPKKQSYLQKDTNLDGPCMLPKHGNNQVDFLLQ